MPKRLLVIVFLFTSTALAKTHTNDFEVPCDNVWGAVRQVLMHSGKYGVLFISNEDMTASYNIGGSLGGRRTNSVQLKPKGAGCTMSVQTAFAGLAHNDAADFLSRVKEALAQNPASKSSESNPSESAPQKPSKGPTPTPQVTPGQLSSVIIKSIPDGADITVDASYVGSTPSTVKLAPGNHAIKVEKPGFKVWQRTMTVSPGSDLSINANLEKE